MKVKTVTCSCGLVTVTAPDYIIVCEVRCWACPKQKPQPQLSLAV